MGLIRVGEMGLLQQQRKPSVLQAFHSMVLRHLFNQLHSSGAGPAVSREPIVLPPGSATVRVSGAAWREVWEIQVWRLWFRPKPYSSTAGQIQTLIAVASQLCFHFCFAAMHWRKESCITSFVNEDHSGTRVALASHPNQPSNLGDL